MSVLDEVVGAERCDKPVAADEFVDELENAKSAALIWEILLTPDVGGELALRFSLSFEASLLEKPRPMPKTAPSTRATISRRPRFDRTELAERA